MRPAYGTAWENQIIIRDTTEHLAAILRNKKGTSSANRPEWAKRGTSALHNE